MLYVMWAYGRGQLAVGAKGVWVDGMSWSLALGLGRCTTAQPSRLIETWVSVLPRRTPKTGWSQRTERIQEPTTPRASTSTPPSRLDMWQAARQATITKTTSRDTMSQTNQRLSGVAWLLSPLLAYRWSPVRVPLMTQDIHVKSQDLNKKRDGKE